MGSSRATGCVQPKEVHMKAALGVLSVALAVGLASCGGREEEEQTAAVSRPDTVSPQMPMGGQGPTGGMGGMGPGMMGDWERHMAAMRVARGDSLRAMMGRHRQMATGMLEMMDSARGGMGMPRDGAWGAMHDSLRQDLSRMEGM